MVWQSQVCGGRAGCGASVFGERHPRPVHVKEPWPIPWQKRSSVHVRASCRRGVRERLLVVPLVRCSGLAALAGPGPFTATPFEGCAGLARRILSSSGARSNRRIIACISSVVGASINANPLDSCVSWFRMTLTESATRSSAASHCLMSSAVTHMGKLPKKTVKLIQLATFTPGWKFVSGLAVQEEGTRSSCLPDDNRPICDGAMLPVIDLVTFNSEMLDA